MITTRTLTTGAVFVSSGLAILLASACGSSKTPSGFDTGNGSSGSGGSGSGSGSGSGGLSFGDGGGSIFNPGDASIPPTPPVTKTDGGVTCVNLQCQQATCADGGSATLTGHIYDPAGNNPLYKVVAYVPNADPEPITDGITSDSCSCSGLYSGTPIADGITDASGTFTVTNAPVGKNIPLVIQIGKWRNYFVIPEVSCGTNNLDTLLPAKLTLPKTQTETKYSNIPNIAISTGNADSLECILKRIGVADSEYTGNPTAQTGHIHIFAGTPSKNGSPGPVPNTANPAGPTSSSSLWASKADIEAYDIVLLSCEGNATGGANAASSTVLANYVDEGGRVFASHYHYAFFNTAADFANVANWSQANGNDSYPDPNNPIGDPLAIDAVVQTTLANGSAFPEGQALETWLKTTVGVLNSSNQLAVPVARHDAIVSSGNLGTVWAESTGVSPESSQYFSWDMPFNAALNDAGQPNYCGRVVYSDLHVGAGENDYSCSAANPNECTYSGTTPTGCTAGKLQPDEDAIEFILFDLSSCVTPVTAPPPPPVVPPPPIAPPK